MSICLGVRSIAPGKRHEIHYLLSKLEQCHVIVVLAVLWISDDFFRNSYDHMLVHYAPLVHAEAEFETRRIIHPAVLAKEEKIPDRDHIAHSSVDIQEREREYPRMKLTPRRSGRLLSPTRLSR